MKQRLMEVVYGMIAVWFVFLTGCGEPQMAYSTTVLETATKAAAVKSALRIYDELSSSDQKKFLPAFMSFCGSPEQLKQIEGKTGREIIEMGKGEQFQKERPLTIVSMTYKLSDMLFRRGRERRTIVIVIDNTFRHGQWEKEEKAEAGQGADAP